MIPTERYPFYVYLLRSTVIYYRLLKEVEYNGKEFISEVIFHYTLYQHLIMLTLSTFCKNIGLGTVYIMLIPLPGAFFSPRGLV